jgi:hypothetical protein
MLNMTPGNTYTFNTTAPAALGVQIKNAKLLEICTYERAIKIENIILKFRQIYPVLPPGTPNNPALFLYYYFESESGEQVLLAEPWIDANTIALVEATNIQITCPNVSLDQITAIRNALNSLGITGYTIVEV